MKNKEIERKEYDKNLVWIEPPKESKDAVKVALKVWGMYEDDFNLTISDICKVLLCERKWVENHVKEEVKHIFLNSPFRKFLNIFNATEFLSIDEENQPVILKDYYYFSRKDFYKWLKKNTVITRQTIKIDILDYCEDKEMFLKLAKEYNKNLKGACSLLEIGVLHEKFIIEAGETLNDTGKILITNKVDATKRHALEINVTRKYNLPDRFTTIKDIKKDIDKSLEMAYRNLYLNGALKYKIHDSLTRYDLNYNHAGASEEGKYIITIPYKLIYKKNKGEV